MAGWPGLMFRSSYRKILFFDARAAWGKSNNEVAVAGFLDTSSFDTTRWLLHGAVTGNREFGKWRVTPTAAISYIEDKQDSFVTPGGVLVPEQTVALGQARFEPEIAYRHVTDDGVLIEPQIKLAGLWDFETPDGLSIPGWEVTTDEFRMRVEAGLLLAFRNGFRHASQRQL